MAAEFLFDISTLDLNAVAVSSDEVSRINPQTGDMRQVDHVIWHNQDYSEGVGVKRVRHDEFWIPGHIPGRPLMPGVLMIEAGAQLCSILYRLKHREHRFLGFIRCNDVVFRGQVVPGDALYLLGKEINYGRRRFDSAIQAVVNGALVFEGKITGMVM